MDKFRRNVLMIFTAIVDKRSSVDTTKDTTMTQDTQSYIARNFGFPQQRCTHPTLYGKVLGAAHVNIHSRDVACTAKHTISTQAKGC